MGTGKDHAVIREIWIVTGSLGAYRQTEHDERHVLVLVMRGKRASLFGTYEMARRAVRRTWGNGWKARGVRIVRGEFTEETVLTAMLGI